MAVGCEVYIDRVKIPGVISLFTGEDFDGRLVCWRKARTTMVLATESLLGSQMLYDGSLRRRIPRLNESLTLGA